MSKPPPLPFGYKYRPKPLGCILDLNCKVTSKPFPYAVPIFDLDPYNVKHLSDILSSLEKKDALYLFTKLPSRTKAGCPIINRQVGHGIWRDDQITDKITDLQGNHVGMARQLTYLEKGSKYHLQIRMTEYSLPVGGTYDPSKDYVLCQITKKSGRRRRMPSKKYQSRSAVVEQPKPYDALAAVKLEPYDDALAAVKLEPYDDALAAVKLEPYDDGIAATAEPMDYESESQTPSLPQLMHKMTKIKV